MKKFSILISGVLVFLFVFPTISQAQDRYLVIPPSALKPVNYYMTDYKWHATSTEFYFESGSVDTVIGTVPVYLPHGATVKKMYVVYMDWGIGTDEYIIVDLQRHDFATGAIQSMAHVDSELTMIDPARRHLKDDVINHAQIDWKYSYDLQVKFFIATPWVKFHGAVIVYEE